MSLSYKDYIWADPNELRKLENRFVHSKKRRVKNKYRNMLKKFYPCCDKTSYLWYTLSNKSKSYKSVIIGYDLAK